MLSFLPPVSTGHGAGLQGKSSQYRGFKPHVHSDKDEMGRVLENGQRPALSNLEELDKALHAKEERSRGP
jgi:hypothetical protein